MRANKIDIAGIVFGGLGILVVFLFVYVVFNIYKDNERERLCESKGGVVFKDRREVHCVKPDFFIPLN